MNEMLTENNNLLFFLLLPLPLLLILLLLACILCTAASFSWFPSSFIYLPHFLLHPSSMDMEDDDDASWVCSACTFHNQECEESCSMCHTIRPGFLWFLAYYGSSFSICRFLRNLLSCSFTAAFALVGAVSGAIAGAFAGCAARSGFFRGSGLGAIAGAALSVEILDASRNYWISHRSEPGHRPFMLNFLDMNYEEIYEMLMPEGRLNGASEEFLKRLPQHTITQCNRMDECGEIMCCAICLQELEQGDIVRTLPVCNHTFHLDCVDKWLVKHVICPICRQYMH